MTISEADFDKIIMLLAAGKHPSSVSIYTDEITFGNAPDGSDREWNVSEVRDATIVGCFLSLAVEPPRVLVGPKMSEAETEAAAENEEAFRRQATETAGGIQALCSGLAATNALLAALRAQFAALIILSLASLAVLVLDYLRR